MTCGIYQIKNKKTHQLYIGQSLNIEHRYKQHLCGHDVKNNSRIDIAIQKHGKENFELSIIKACKSRYLNRFEKLYIQIHNTFKDTNHYNLDGGGKGTPNRKWTDEERIMRSGKNHYFYGKKRPEHSKKMCGKNNPNYGSKIDELGGIDFIKSELEKEKTLTKISEELNYSQGALSNYCKRRGLKINRKYNKGNENPNYGSIIDEYGGLWFLKQMKSQGLSQRNISEYIGCSQTNIPRYLKSKGHTWNTITNYAEAS